MKKIKLNHVSPGYSIGNDGEIIVIRIKKPDGFYQDKVFVKKKDFYFIEIETEKRKFSNRGLLII